MDTHEAGVVWQVVSLAVGGARHGLAASLAG